MTGRSLPQPDKKKIGAPVVPFLVLPHEGRTEPVPDCPVALGEDGQCWWDWAWTTPQATTWSARGDLHALARRAQMQDIWADEPTPAWAAAMKQLDEQYGLTKRSLLSMHMRVDDNPAQIEREISAYNAGPRLVPDLGSTVELSG